MLRRILAIATCVALPLLTSACSDSTKQTTGEQPRSTAPTSQAGPEAYDEILGAIVALDDADHGTGAPTDPASANQALGWSEASSPYMFTEYAYDDASEVGRWCITSKQGAYLTMTTDGDDTRYMVGDGQQCRYEEAAARVTAIPREPTLDDTLTGQVRITKGVDLLGEELQTATSLEPLVAAVDEIDIPVDADTETAPDTVPADVTGSLPSGYEIRDYQVPGHGEWYSYCLVDTATGAWVIAGSDGVVGSGPSGAACTWEE